MSFLHWNDDHTRIKGFSSSGKSGSTVIKIELVTTDPIAAGFMMNDLAEAQAAAKRPKSPAGRATSASRISAQRALAAPLLALPAPGGRSSG